MNITRTAKAKLHHPAEDNSSSDTLRQHSNHQLQADSHNRRAMRTMAVMMLRQDVRPSRRDRRITTKATTWRLHFNLLSKHERLQLAMAIHILNLESTAVLVPQLPKSTASKFQARTVEVKTSTVKTA